jgi:beta-1,4-mannosyltransferase
MTLIRVLAFPAYKNKNSNPYNYLLYSGIEEFNISVREFSFMSCLSLRYDVIHIHWPEIYLNSNYLIKNLFYSVALLLSLFTAKVFSKKIIWTAHNLKPHHIKYKLLNILFWKCYLRLVSGVVSLSESNEKLLFNELKELHDLPAVHIHHGLYKGFYPDDTTSEEARNRLSLDKHSSVSLFIGQVKRYKNVEVLINLFSHSPHLKESILIIAGQFESEAYFHEINTMAQSNKNIIIHNKFIPDTELQYYFRAADLCIFPFKDIFNSGSVLLSVSFDTPVLVPHSPNFEEYSLLVNNGLISTYTDQIKPEDIVAMLNDSSAEQSLCSEENLGCEDISWPVLQSKLAGFYNQVLSQ